MNSDSLQFIHLYAREYGMPHSKDNSTDVKDYIYKLIEYKSMSDESSLSDDKNLIDRTKNLQKELDHNVDHN